MSQKVTLTKQADGSYTAATEDAVIGDIITTLLSSDQAVTGWMKFGQMGAMLVGGMAIQEKRRSGKWNPL